MRFLLLQRKQVYFIIMHMRVYCTIFFCFLSLTVFAEDNYGTCGNTNCTTNTNGACLGMMCTGQQIDNGKYFSDCGTGGYIGPSDTICPEGLYCPGDGYAYCCNSIASGAFPNSAQRNENDVTIGAKSKYECYKKLDGETGNGHGKKCKDQSDGYIEYSDSDNTKKCRAYYRGDDETPYVSCNDTTGTDSGTGEIEQSQNIDSAGYHMEDDQCYFNTRNCNLFHNNCGSNLGSNQVSEVFGTLQWHGDDNWNYDQNCGCRIKGDFITTDNYGCNGHFSRGLSSVTEAETVSSTQVSFNNNQLNPYCSGCLPGYYSDGDSNDTGFICKIAEQGYYSFGCGTYYTNDEPNETENSAANCWSYTNGTRFPCYAGMTTDSSGATGPSACHYTNNTQFCDAYGCVSMEQLLGATQTLSQNDWTWYMQQ